MEALDGSSTGADGGGDCTVAYSQGSLSGEWRVENSRDMQEQVEAAGCTFIQASANDDVAKQLQDVNDLLARKPDLLVVAPVQYEPLAPVPGLADAAGVPLIVVDRELPGTPGEGQYEALITIDFVESGRKVAESIVAGLTEKNGAPKGRIVHITGTTGSSPVIDMQEGIDEVLADNPGIEIAGSCDGLYAAEPGRKCMEDLLQRFDAGTIDGVVADNDESALGAIQAIKAADRTELFPWVWGKDAQRTGLEAMLAGEMYYTISTPPQYGAITMETWRAAQEGTLEDTKILLPKTEYQIGTKDATEQIKARIEELRAQNLNCC
ncbi:ribose transport system substrate-binding protein [Promicromonospora umidemergens]|uniref:ABC transporter substrate-binding protein n=1 Tax=Promicromonospora umidemergens TaxID=629679 RepID=A0ABP8XYB0_9MICO|nr:substrate-binding domain-containing protein [Promicromonospora umidemergens]MCP2284182.1 ribose transport system substrate-binding protein [Promicromonospora umidemergens]